MLRLREEVSRLLSPLINMEISAIKELLEEPPEKEMGDVSFPCFILAKKERKSPAVIAAELKDKVSSQRGIYWSDVTNTGPYLNFFINYINLGKEIIPEITGGQLLKKWCNQGEGKTVVIDYSAPNIAKPFGIGHLRSTIIGNSLYRIYEAMGYKCVGINHLGDWGTQFGKLITAYRLWGDATKLKENPVDYLYELYVMFHREAKEKSSLDDDAREWFRLLENGDKEAEKLWQEFCRYSLEEFKRVYGILGVSFDHYQGESFFNSYLENTIAMIRQKGITRESEGALIIDLEPYGLPPCILQKKDGSTLYITRDLAAAIYRYDNFRFEKMLYVVGSEQTLHFQQLFKILELMGYNWADKCEHIPFGLIRFKEGKMSTREGNIILLKEVMERAIKLADDIIEEKNPDLADKNTASRAVAMGAVKFGDLSNDRIKNIDFDWQKVLDFSGETAPYIQYSHARICSILRRAGKEGVITSSRDKDLAQIIDNMEAEEEKALLKELATMPLMVLHSAKFNKPSLLARYLIGVAREFNRFYHNCPVLTAEKGIKHLRLLLIQATRDVLAEGLELLGIEAPEEM